MARQRFCWLFVDVVQWEHLVAVVVGMPSRLGVGVAPSGHLLPLPHYLLHFPLPFDVLQPIDLVLFFVSVYFLWWKPLIN